MNRVKEKGEKKQESVFIILVLMFILKFKRKKFVYCCFNSYHFFLVQFSIFRFDR